MRRAFPIDAHMVPCYPIYALRKGKYVPANRKAKVSSVPEAPDGILPIRLAKLCLNFEVPGL